VTPGYFETLRLSLREGRTFTASDGLSAPMAMIVNRGFEQQYYAGRRALGGRVRIGGDTTYTYTIVGVVDDVHHNTLTGVVKPQFYVTLAQFAVSPGNTRRSMSLVVRTDGDPAALISAVRSTVKAVDPRLPLSEVRTMREIVNAAIGGQRFAMQTLGVFGGVALLLSAIGIFGIVSQVVASRFHEFGIRAALGASPRELMAISLRSGLRQAMVGLGVGIVAALMLTRVLGALLQDVSSTDPLTFIRGRRGDWSGGGARESRAGATCGADRSEYRVEGGLACRRSDGPRKPFGVTDLGVPTLGFARRIGTGLSLDGC
jgi:hypothetical protein